jgi:anti-anti-sigma factor
LLAAAQDPGKSHPSALEGRTMPGTSGRNASVSPSVSVSVSVSPDRSAAVVRLGGEIDIGARPDLDEVVRQLTLAVPDRIDVDMSEVTFVGAVLPNFLVQIRQAMPARSVLTVSQPSPFALFVLHLSDLADIADIADVADIAEVADVA